MEIVHSLVLSALLIFGMTCGVIATGLPWVNRFIYDEEKFETPMELRYVLPLSSGGVMTIFILMNVVLHELNWGCYLNTAILLIIGLCMFAIGLTLIVVPMMMSKGDHLKVTFPMALSLGSGVIIASLSVAPISASTLLMLGVSSSC